VEAVLELIRRVRAFAGEIGERGNLGELCDRAESEATGAPLPIPESLCVLCSAKCSAMMFNLNHNVIVVQCDKNKPLTDVPTERKGVR